MARKPTVSSDSVAQDQIRVFVERIMRMREEERAIKADIREIYAEAKGNGLDKTILGKVVNYVEKRSTKADEMAEADALFDLYLSAFDGVRRGDDEDDEETGTPVATHTHEATTKPATTAAASEVGGQERPADLATQSTSAPTAAAEVTTPDANTHGQTGTADERARSHVPANAEAVAKQVGQSEQEAAVEPPVDTSNVLKLSDKPLRPYCVPDASGVCASPGGRKHCFRCEQAHANRIPVEAGGTVIEHHGSING